MDEKILFELNRISKLLAMNLAMTLKTEEKFITLNRVGFQPKEIAELFNTTNNFVSKSLSNARKAKKK